MSALPRAEAGTDPRIAVGLGIACILMGALLNPWVMAWVAPDGDIESARIRGMILAVDGAVIAVGVALLVFRPTIAVASLRYSTGPLRVKRFREPGLVSPQYKKLPASMEGGPGLKKPPVVAVPSGWRWRRRHRLESLRNERVLSLSQSVSLTTTSEKKTGFLLIEVFSKLINAKNYGYQGSSPGGRFLVSQYFAESGAG
jgi:hypothetical protein